MSNYFVGVLCMDVFYVSCIAAFNGYIFTIISV